MMPDRDSISTERTAASDAVFPDAEALARNVAQWLCTLALGSDRPFAICCSGGSTPKRLYQLLAEPEIVRQFPWSRVHWFWGDERFVPHEHPDSNFRLVHDALFSRVAVPHDNIHPIPTSGQSPQHAASAYEATLKAYYRAPVIVASRPLFDVTLLGIGEDGHTASLFPGHPALEQRDDWAVAVTDATPPARITLTYPVINSSRDAAFLVAGNRKREIVARIRSGDQTLPAARIHPSGRLHWFSDRAAAPE